MFRQGALFSTRLPVGLLRTFHALRVSQSDMKDYFSPGRRAPAFHEPQQRSRVGGKPVIRTRPGYWAGVLGKVRVGGRGCVDERTGVRARPLGDTENGVRAGMDRGALG